jgi:hypothetical protein
VGTTGILVEPVTRAIIVWVIPFRQQSKDAFNGFNIGIGTYLKIFIVIDEGICAHNFNLLAL